MSTSLSITQPNRTSANPPALESAIARVGVLIVVAMCVAVGFAYWAPRDLALAWLNVAAELIAFAGLSVARWQSEHDWRIGAGAFAVTLLAASWCGLTMFQKIGDDTRANALTAARERPAYVFAEAAAATARDLLNDRLARPNPRSACACPQTIAAWESSEAAQIDRLRQERDAAVLRMETSIPPTQTDWLAIARGIGIELVKLVGLLVMGLKGGLSGSQPAPPTAAQPRQPTSTSASKRAAAATPGRHTCRSVHAGGWSALKAIGIVLIGATATQPVQPSCATDTTQSLNHPPVPRPAYVAEAALAVAARQLSATMGERRIAAHLTLQSGAFVSRHRVQILLGRQRAGWPP